MKNKIKISFIYLIVGMLAGVFYREFSKFLGITNSYSTLGLVHTHLLILGVIMITIITLLNDKFNKDHNKLNKISFITYNVGVSGAALMMLIRGTINLLIDANKIKVLSSGIDKMISGLSGMFHITLGVSIILIFITYLKEDKTL